MKKYIFFIAILPLFLSCKDSNRSLDKQFVRFNKELSDNKKLLNSYIEFLSDEEYTKRNRLEIIRSKLRDCDIRLDRLEYDYKYGELNSEKYNLEVLETQRTAVRLIKMELKMLKKPIKNKTGFDVNNDRLKKFYDYVLATKKVDGSFLGDYNTFSDLVADSNNRVKLFKNLAKAGFTENEIGTEQQFHDYFNEIFSNRIIKK